MRHVGDFLFRRATATFPIAMLCLAAVWASAETIELKNGRKMEGRIVSVKERFLTIETGGALVTLSRDGIVEPDAAELLSQARGLLASGDANAAVDLCRKILLWHPSDAQAGRVLKEAQDAVSNAESLPAPTPLSPPSEAKPAEEGTDSPSAEIEEAPGIALSPLRGPRTLAFPEGWEVGTLFLRTAGTANALNLKQRDWLNGKNDPTWVEGPRARGKVPIPPGREVMLRVAGATSDLDFIGNLAENDLYALQFEPGCVIDDEDMARIGRLTGLRELYVYAYDSKITGKGAEALAGLAQLRTLDFSGAEGVRGNDLAFLSSLSDLRELNLYGVYIRSTDLDYVGDLASLEVLGLGNAVRSGFLQFADEDLKRLAPLTALKSLDLYGAQGITGRGLGYLRGAASLESLVLAGVQALQDENLAELEPLRNLKVLDLTDTPVTGKGLANLTKTSLVELRLGGADNRLLTDADLEKVAGLESLRKLRLAGTKSITDAGLDHLKKMTLLQELNLVDLNVTAPAIESLKTALPNCRIVVGPTP